MVASDRRFETHAPSRSQTLNQPKDEELDLLGWKRTDKDKEKVLPDLPAITAREESLVKSKLCTHVDTIE
ncbi:hypothetical protein PtA15_11A271 [Puccinia triticina]|uniref:Uncharacterized protein n=1 Tax=Puccinia triticina TaxID=208348 RepID=A0ABY7CWI5_9BASI|nr:uncharacterized protein PtA15_11A271 [Puccinia triticina]WAQ89581.1 hypothetical protein PtA15_11A271 [Puccinia triticina]